MNTKAVFSRVASPRVKIPLLVFMSEKKINLTPEKIKFFVSYMLKCGKMTHFSPSAVTTENVISRQFYDVQRVYWV